MVVELEVYLCHYSIQLIVSKVLVYFPQDDLEKCKLMFMISIVMIMLSGEIVEITRNVSPLMNPCPSASNSLQSKVHMPATDPPTDRAAKIFAFTQTYDLDLNLISTLIPGLAEKMLSK